MPKETRLPPLSPHNRLGNLADGKRPIFARVSQTMQFDLANTC
jgi:hypothetical protein